MIRSIVAAACLLLAACQGPTKAAYEYSADLDGRPWPEECRRDLTHLQIPIFRTPKENLPYRVLGMWVNIDGKRFILIAEGLVGYAYDDTLHHELCHEAMYLKTGNSKWHN